MENDSVTLIEVGSRDGLQREEPLSTETKLKMIEALVATGLRRLQVTSFVHPDLVPQMADAEKLCAHLPERDEVVYSGLALNDVGVERAADAGLSHVDLSVSTSDTHSRKNAGMPLEEARTSLLEIIELAQDRGLHVRAGLQCVFGCAYEGTVPVSRVVEMAREIVEAGAEWLSLADSTGMAGPRQVEEVVSRVQEVAGETPIILHLHDTRGLGLANVWAGVEAGVRHFDTAFGGAGGCPFIPGATGNIATEDTIYLLERLGIEVEADRDAIAEVSLRAEDLLDKTLPGKHHRLYERQPAAP
jgi:hydroxymethylglutaryl-CoA lyase